MGFDSIHGQFLSYPVIFGVESGSEHRAGIDGMLARVADSESVVDTGSRRGRRRMGDIARREPPICYSDRSQAVISLYPRRGG